MTGALSEEIDNWAVPRHSCYGGSFITCWTYFLINLAIAIGLVMGERGFRMKSYTQISDSKADRT